MSSSNTEFVTRSAPANQSRDSVERQSLSALREDPVPHVGQDCLFVISCEEGVTNRIYAKMPVAVGGSEIHSRSDLSVELEGEEDRAWSELAREAFKQALREDD